MELKQPDVKPNPTLRYVRASVADRCNLSCVYCPKQTGMENFVPASFANHRLSTADYCRTLEHIAAAGFNGISFTGGEPTLNKDLPVIVEHARGIFQRVEMTTNGRFLPRQLDQLAPHLDLVKVSLDSTDPELSHRIMRGRRVDFDRASTAIKASLETGVNVGVNVVAMRQNLDEIEKVIDLARRMRRETGGTIYVSVLDLYYTDETRQFWLDEFVPLDDIIGTFEQRYGAGDWQHRRGTEFGWFVTEDVQVRFKSSYASTYRSARCDTCPVYCQEGMYALKLSVEGWVTLCPSNSEDMGTLLPAGIEPEEAQRRLGPLMDELRSTRRVKDSFEQMLARRDLELALR
ncbi:radical SAM protein [Streptomyces tauricus]|uniref:Radical SAM protein n=1 Tax=Streptomyces tauricus TaxID=68274 RepID=A0ABZ1JSU3_9ACTN|nr:radical SAM protein [Streptomyces tauricus]